jgi:hypothetical protein
LKGFPAWPRGACVGFAIICLFGSGCKQLGQEVASPRGDAVIRGPGVASDIVITTTSRLAGAVHSLQWRGREFIDSTDHGRQLQSASNFDAGQNPIRAETFNPTEAGSRRDHVGPTSSSRLLALQASGHRLESSALMAFWLAPEDKSQGHQARNRTVLSEHRLTKRIEIGAPFAGAITYDVSYQVPTGEGHRFGVFESLTGYMPPEFSRFWRFDAAAGRLVPLDDGPGEQLQPVVLATPDGEFAMGIWSPDPGARYGRFRFTRERVVKWNCVFRRGDKDHLLPSGEYTFRHRVLVGTVADVEASLRRLTLESQAAR